MCFRFLFGICLGKVKVLEFSRFFSGDLIIVFQIFIEIYEVMTNRLDVLVIKVEVRNDNLFYNLFLKKFG